MNSAEMPRPREQERAEPPFVVDPGAVVDLGGELVEDREVAVGQDELVPGGVRFDPLGERPEVGADEAAARSPRRGGGDRGGVVDLGSRSQLAGGAGDPGRAECELGGEPIDVDRLAVAAERVPPHRAASRPVEFRDGDRDRGVGGAPAVAARDDDEPVEVGDQLAGGRRAGRIVGRRLRRFEDQRGGHEQRFAHDHRRQVDPVGAGDQAIKVDPQGMHPESPGDDGGDLGAAETGAPDQVDARSCDRVMCLGVLRRGEPGGQPLGELGVGAVKGERVDDLDEAAELRVDLVPSGEILDRSLIEPDRAVHQGVS